MALLGACAAPTATWTPGSTPSPTSSPTPTGPPTITLAFGGDVHFAERTLKLLDDPSTAFGPISSVFTAADVAMVNLESAVTERGTPEPKTFHFRAPATSYDALRAAGIDIASLANNHALDYGQVGLEDTLDSAAEKQFPIVGAGRDADQAYGAWVEEVKGVRIAFLGMSQIGELASRWVAKDDRPGIAMAFDTERAVNAVKEAKESADVVVVFMHWGIEYNECASSQQKSFAAKLASAGASIIVGSHVHKLQGDGWLGKTYVAYGLSNFLWWYNDAASNDTGVIRVTLTGTSITKTEFLPAYIDRKTGQPKIVSGSEAERISKKFTSLRSCTGLKSTPA